MTINEEYTHGFHPYAAKFPAYAIRDYIVKYSKDNEWVLDPFCGSGTTLVECRLLGRNGVGIELNPVAKLISETKSALYTMDDISKVKKVITKIKNDSFYFKEWIVTHTSDVNILENHPNKEYWFKPHVLLELQAIKSIIEDYHENTNVYNLLLTAFSRIIVPVSNQDSETRYKSINKDIIKGDALKLYIKTISNYAQILEDNNYMASKKVNIKVIEGDSTKQIKNFEPESFDFILTSPPYINSFDYYLYHKHRIFWLEKDPKLVRKYEIGNHHKIGTKSYKKAVSDYILQLNIVFLDINRVLKKNKYFVMFIGDGIIKNQIVDCAEIIYDIIKNTDFNITKIDSTPLRNVSRGFIKGKNLNRKKQHIITMQKK